MLSWERTFFCELIDRKSRHRGNRLAVTSWIFLRAGFRVSQNRLRRPEIIGGGVAERLKLDTLLQSRKYSITTVRAARLVESVCVCDGDMFAVRPPPGRLKTRQDTDCPADYELPNCTYYLYKLSRV